MARRRRTSPFEDMVAVASMLPWWLALLLMPVSYFGLSALAESLQAPPPKSVAEMGSHLQMTIFRTAALFGQYGVTAILGLGAALSGFKKYQSRKSMSFTTAGSQEFAAGTPKNWDPNLDRRAADLRASQANTGGQSAPAGLDSVADVERLLDLIEWRRFEAMVELFYQSKGYITSSQSHGADGGVDIKLSAKDTPDVLVAVVQCKHWAKRSVGVEALRALRGSMVDLCAPRGIFVTSSSFSADALEFAAGNQIETLSRKDLIAGILSLPAEQRLSIRAAALHGDYQTPTCASCGTKMVKRTPRTGGQPFWGCVNYPRCRSVIRIARS